jgi:hypothetical protein
VIVLMSEQDIRSSEYSIVSTVRKCWQLNAVPGNLLLSVL